MDERKRTGRTLANDLALRSAAVNGILRMGIDRLSHRDIAKVAGLTHTTGAEQFSSTRTERPLSVLVGGDIRAQEGARADPRIASDDYCVKCVFLEPSR